MTVQDVDNAFRKKAESNVKLYVIRKKIENGTATMEDMSEYSNILCKLLGKALGENISGIPESERAKFCEWLLRNQYEDTNERLATVQRFLDKKQNIHIAAKKPKFPAERVRKAAHSLEDKTVSEEVIQRRAENAVANIANSFHDDYIKENAEFRQNAGLKCHVTRTGASKCCAWCAEVAGRFEVGREPADFWRRHDNCSCRMDYENQKVRQRLSGTGKGWKVDSEVQRRQAQRIQYKPKRFSREEAKVLESEKLSQYKGLKNSIDESDKSFFQKIKDMFSKKESYEETIVQFESRISNLNNKNAASVFTNVYQNTTFEESKKKKSYFNRKDGKVYLTPDATSSTIAHELFHKVDYDNDIVKNGFLDSCIKNDYGKLKKSAEKTGQTIEDMLYLKYPEAFDKKGKMKKAFRGVSDIIHGMTNGEVKLGYGHGEGDSYWKKPNSLQKETFAQYGRFYFDENSDVLRIITEIFPETTQQMDSILKIISLYGA